MPGMGNQKQGDTADHANGLPAMRVVFNTLLPGDMQGIFEDEHSSFKADAMFALIARFLASSHENIVTLNV